MKLFYVFCLLPALVSSVDYSILGTEGLEVYEYMYTTEVDSDNMYTLTMVLKHNANFPIGDAEKCQPLEIASDGKGYLAARWYFERFDSLTSVATGFDHVSVDYNACGHPPEAFLQAHYDVHLYTATLDERLGMTCDELSSAPICNPGNGTQTTASGEAFFQVARSVTTGSIRNMPEGFEIDPTAAVQYMGMHVMESPPASASEWTEPVLAYCTFDSDVVAFEPMFPFHFNHGTEDHFFQKEIVVEDKTIGTLPTYLSIAYEASTGQTTIVVKGKSATSAVDFGDPITYSSVKEPSSAAPSQAFWCTIIAMTLTAVSTSVFLFA